MSAIAYILAGMTFIGLVVSLIAVISGGRGTRKEEFLWHHDGEW